MKIKNSLLVCCLGFLPLAVHPVSAQTMTSPSMASGLMGGLLGEDYAGLEFGYVRHHESAPGVMQRYGFVASRPLPEGKDLDGIFRFNHTRGSTLGPDGSQNDFSAGVAAFMRNGPVAPFAEGDIGWAWAKATGVRTNSFLYQVRAGAEVMVSRQVSLTPYVGYQEVRRFHDHAWQFGTKAAFRINLMASATLALQIDEANNFETMIGLQRRF